MSLLAAVIAGTGMLIKGGIQLVGGARARDEAVELSEIARGDARETEEMNQNLRKQGQALTQENITHNDRLATNEIGLAEDQAQQSETALNRSILGASSDSRATSTFGNVSAKQNRIARRENQSSSIFGRQ
jgi:hypothetical protein